MHKVIKIKDISQAEVVGRRIGESLRGGEVIEFISDLGGGKTTLTRYIVAGAGSKDHVSSPTFTISNVYNAKNFSIYHFDFYRLSEAGLMEHELSDVLDDKSNVVIVEWSDVAKHVLPADRLTIQINATGESSRELICDFPESLKYIIGDI
jgi:tRNA threonylcarbamoyladenosine biosynthesis protein TsaE